MGVCINHELLQRRKHVEDTLTKTEDMVKILKENQADKVGVSMMVRRPNKYQLYVDIEGCETLAFDFIKTDEVEDWQREYAILLPHAEKQNEMLAEHAERMKPHNVQIDVDGNELLISRSFCKTQYGVDVTHKFVAEILRFVASQCYGVVVNDEGDYYNSHDLRDAMVAKEQTRRVMTDVIRKIND